MLEGVKGVMYRTDDREYLGRSVCVRTSYDNVSNASISPNLYECSNWSMGASYEREGFETSRGCRLPYSTERFAGGLHPDDEVH